MNLIYKAIRKIETLSYRSKLERLSKKKKSLNAEKRDVPIIASLTSFPARFDDLYLVIESIFRQSVLPDKILLYLDKDVQESSLPSSLIKLKNYGLSIIIGGEEIKPHKKYYYAMKDNPDSIIITFDDDNLYRADTIEKLINSYKHFPNCVSCMRAHRMRFEGKELMPYNDWDIVYTDMVEKASSELFATGVGGVLYPPHCMISELYNIDRIKDLCLNADDIWLKYIQLMSHTKVVAVESNRWLANPLPAKTRMVGALSVCNVAQNANDEYIHRLEMFYKRSFFSLCYEDDENE